MNYENYIKWRDDPFFDDATREEVSALSEQEAEDRFCRDLKFGTGGLRGKLGAGTNRMNRYTVGRATQGLAEYLLSEKEGGSAVIAYDSRRFSDTFALEAALILAGNGIKTYLFEALRPTPELSFAVRYFGAAVGVVITASHNPAEYNGYKVYSSDGGQIVPPEDEKIISHVSRVRLDAVKRLSREEAIAQGLLEFIGEEVDLPYLAAIKRLCLTPPTERGKVLKIVYSPLHGTGNLLVRRALAASGFSNVFVVPEQELPDGDFPTVERPNPEDPAAFALALDLAHRVDADLVLATDPDADRLGLYVKDGADYLPFTGNMSGLLLGEYLLSRREALGLLPENRADGAVVTTIVSSDMGKKLAEGYGLSYFETLTGFKYIGERIRLLECAGKKFEYGYEESYGCLAGDYVRDKDGVSASLLLCEAAAYYAEQGLTLADAMRLLYEKYGYFREAAGEMKLCGCSDAKTERMMEALRAAPPVRLGGKEVIAVRDYESGVRIARGGHCAPLDLPTSNVLYFELDGGWCCVRPSGTEEKIKFYYGTEGSSLAETELALCALKEDFLTLCLGRTSQESVKKIS